MEMPTRVSDPRPWANLADWLVIAIAASLPWSTSTSGILIALWFIAFLVCLITLLPSLDFPSVRREALSLPSSLPVLLWLMAGMGMFWADAGWAQRLDAFQSFGKLLAIPLLLAHFRRSTRGKWVLIAFLLSCTILLVASFYLAFWPGLRWRGHPDNFAVPTKDYITQSVEFVVCAFALLPVSIGLFPKRPWTAFGCLALVMLFIANVLYVSSGRTAWVVATTLLIVFAFRQLRRLNACLIVVAAILCAWTIWETSSYLRSQVGSMFAELHGYVSGNAPTRVGLRLEFWKKSMSFIYEAPIFGHGTGSTKELFRRSAVGQAGASAAVTVNTHNQTLAVAVQLGLAGVALLYAMWAAHLLLFSGKSLTAWFGFVIVLQNLVSCLFNSHLTDFTQGWLYVFGVGVAAGTLSRSQVNYSKSPELVARDSAPPRR
jgi:O-antigen ligase